MDTQRGFVAHPFSTTDERFAVRQPSDDELLTCFLGGQDETAFSALVARYGLLVAAACGQVLRQRQDVEDASQATFLVLMRKAESYRVGASLATWLFGIARGIARNMQRSRNRRRRCERHGRVPAPAASPQAATSFHELQHFVAAEVECLPQPYRLPFVRCCLENRSKAEVAEELGWPEGTVSSRLARATEQVRRGLRRRGIVPPWRPGGSRE